MSFHEYASDWLRRRRSGELGDPLSDNTHADYQWRLKKHILPFFARMPVAEIRDVDCQRFRAKLFAEREKLRELIAGGAKPKDRRGSPRKPLSNRSIQMQMGLFAQILDDAVEDKLRKDNPARAKRLKVKVPKPNRTFLEIDQLVALFDAARELERDPRSTKRAKLTTEQAAEIRARLATGETQATLCREYGLAAGSMSMLAQEKTYRGENERVGWRALCATLGYAGPRISEALDLHERDVRLQTRPVLASGSPTARPRPASGMSRSRLRSATSSSHTSQTRRTRLSQPGLTSTSSALARDAAGQTTTFGPGSSNQPPSVRARS